MNNTCQCNETPLEVQCKCCECKLQLNFFTEEEFMRVCTRSLQTKLSGLCKNQFNN